MSLSILHPVAVFALLLTGSVFVISFKFAVREATTQERDDVPRARVLGASPTSRNRWHRGALRQWFIRHGYLAQAALVAFGITAVFLMTVCMTGICLAMALGR